MPNRLEPRDIKGIVVHLSASGWGGAAEISSWHKARGWSEIGYHGVILNGVRHSNQVYIPDLDGKIEPGRKETLEGAHCLAKGMNTCSIGVCCIGNPGFPVRAAVPAPSALTVRPYLTMKQYESLVYWLAVNCVQYDIDPLGTLRRPADGKIVPAISQHSDHDPGKPFCASLRLHDIRYAVANKVKHITP